MLHLTKRQTEIAGYIALGSTEKEIADKLFISEATVHAHKKLIFKNLKAKSVADVTRKVIEQLTGKNLTALIREHVIEPNAVRVTAMLIFLSLQLTATITGLDERVTRVRSVRITRVTRTRKTD